MDLHVHKQIELVEASSSCGTDGCVIELRQGDMAEVWGGGAARGNLEWRHGELKRWWREHSQLENKELRAKEVEKMRLAMLGGLSSPL